MAGGMKEGRINTGERVVSTDVNRFQKFKAKDIAELFRYLIDVSNGMDDLDSGGVTIEYASQESPVRAEIINGFLVRPQIGSLNILIDPGLLFAVDPEVPLSPDDSAYKYVHDDGIAVAGALAMIANSSGSTRIDVIECQRVEEIAETDSRDMFDTTTGLFVPKMVTKATASGLVYRVRAGTPGGGWPGTALGWLPLAVASVPNGTTTCDTVTFWDVRPLLSDREFGVTNSYRTNPELARSVIRADNTLGTPGTVPVNGYVDAVLQGRRVGGRLRRGTPGTDGNTVNFGSSGDVAAGFTFASGSFFYYYLVTPFGLPRWARYTDVGTGNRVPRSPRGIPVVSGVAPNHQTNISSSNIPLPTSTGLGGSGPGVCFFSGRAFHAIGWDLGGSSDGKRTWPGLSQGRGFPVMGTDSNWNSGTAQIQWTLTEGVDFPANAKRLYVAIEEDADLLAPFFTTSPQVPTYGSLGDQGLMTITDPSGGGVTMTPPLIIALGVGNSTASPIAVTLKGPEFMIPLPTQYPNGPGGPYTLTWSIPGNSGLGGTRTHKLFVTGWDIGP